MLIAAGLVDGCRLSASPRVTGRGRRLPLDGVDVRLGVAYQAFRSAPR